MANSNEDSLNTPNPNHNANPYIYIYIYIYICKIVNHVIIQGIDSKV